MTSPRIGLICAISMAFAWHLPSVQRTLDRVFRDLRFGTARRLRPIDARDPASLIRITGPGGDSAAAGATENEAHIVPRDYLAYRDRNQSFDGLAAGHIGGPMRVRVDGRRIWFR